MRATIERWGRGLVALAALTALAACTLGREPAYDAALAGEVTELTAGTLRLFRVLIAVCCMMPHFPQVSKGFTGLCVSGCCILPQTIAYFLVGVKVCFLSGGGCKCQKRCETH